MWFHILSGELRKLGDSVSPSIANAVKDSLPGESHDSSIGSGIGQQFSVWRAWRQWCRGDVGGMAPPLLEKVKMGVESWQKILGGLREERNRNLMLV